MTATEVSALEIQPFAPGHHAGVVRLVLGIQQGEFGFAVTYEGQPDLQDIAGFFRQGAGNFWVALAGANVVGTIGLVDIGNRQGALRKMFVDRAYRGGESGAARRLMAALFDWARAHDIDDIYLGTTAKFLAAHRFYEKLGFDEVASAALPQRFPRMNVDTKFYRIHLALGGAPVTPS